MVDIEPARVHRVIDELKSDFPFVIGDATDDATLLSAGIARSQGVISALSSDKDNIFATITARALQSSARIVAKAVEPTAEAKLRRAGADAVVSPNFLGGVRMASEMIRPNVVKFLDRLESDRELGLRLGEIRLGATSAFLGHTLASARIRSESGALVLAVQRVGGEYVYNPTGSFRLESGMTLIAIGHADDLVRLRHTIGT